MFCVADLQFNNQKLQEEVRKLKQAVEAMEDTNQKLMEENEELKTQAKVYTTRPCCLHPCLSPSLLCLITPLCIVLAFGLLP